MLAASVPVANADLETWAYRYAEGGDLPLDWLWPGRKPAMLSLPGYPFECLAYRPALSPQQTAMLCGGGPAPQGGVSENAAHTILSAVTSHLDRITAHTLETEA